MARDGVPALASPRFLGHTERVADPSQFDDTDMTPEEFRSRLERAVPADLYIGFGSLTVNVSSVTSPEVLSIPALGQVAHWGQEVATAS